MYTLNPEQLAPKEELRQADGVVAPAGNRRLSAKDKLQLPAPGSQTASSNTDMMGKTDQAGHEALGTLLLGGPSMRMFKTDDEWLFFRQVQTIPEKREK